MAGSSRTKTMAIPAVPPSHPTPFPQGEPGTPAGASNVGTPFVAQPPSPPHRRSVPPPTSVLPAPPAPIAVPPSQGKPWKPASFRGPDAARPLLEVESVPVRSVATAVEVPAVPPALALEWVWTDEKRLPDAVDALSDASSYEHQTADPQHQVRRMVREVPASTLNALEMRLRGREDAPVYGLVTGRLVLSFDVRSKLETMVALARPFAVEGEALHQDVAHAEAVLETPVEGAPEVAQRLAERLERTWRDTPQRRAAYDLSDATQRVLLTRRAYAKLAVFGEAHLQALLTDGREHAMVYLPEAVAASLPLYAEFDARLLVAVHARQDAMAVGALALRSVALARAATP